MENKQIVIDGVDVAKCRYFTSEWDFNNCGHICKGTECEYKRLWYKKQLKHKEQECEELHSRTASIIYSLTGGRLSYSTYTLEGCEQAYHDQLEIDVERATKELEEKLQAKEQECEELRRSITKIFACLIKANKTNKIVDTLWVDDITTLWDYIALTLGIEGDQTQIEEQILQKISEYKGAHNEKIR